MNSNQITIEIDDPVVVSDSKSGMYTAHFEQFPQISAAGYTAEEAEKYAWELLPLVFNEDPKEFMNILFEKYLTEAQKNLLKARVVKNDSRRLLKLARS